MKQVNLKNARYLGGLPGDKGGYGGRLMVDDEGISVGQFKSPGKGGPVKWSEMSGVSFDTETASKSRVGKALLVGIFALAAKNTQSQSHITVNLKNGQVTLYEVNGKSGQAVRGMIQPFLTEQGVPCLDGNLTVASEITGTASSVDELVKLSELHASGALTDEEFSAAKSDLLNLD